MTSSPQAGPFRPGLIAGLVMTALLAGACVLSALGYGERAVNVLGGEALRAENDRYLETTMNKAVASFAVMSVLKAGLSIIEGSDVGASLGLSMHVQIGDFVQPAYDYVDIAWRTLLLGSVTLLGIRYLLQATMVVDSWLLTATFALALAVWLTVWLLPNLHRLKQTLTDLLRVAVVGTLALYYILPLSVWGAARLSELITAPAIRESEAGFTAAKEELFPENETIPQGLMDKFEAAQNKMRDVFVFLKDRARDMIVWTVQIIAGYIFDCLVFPVTLFYLLLWATRGALGYVFQLGFQRALVRDLARVLGQRPQVRDTA
ncbi:MAG: hypothetical protein EOM25_03180 [Deltaproteobacteria bacterium]|nr:hypothetical protein [Deltaproteobacteria bacterium]